MGYEPRYTKVDKRTVRAVREFLDTNPYRGTHGERITALERLVGRIAPAYRVPTPRVTVEPHSPDVPDLGRFDRGCNTVVLPKFSLLAVLTQVAAITGKPHKKARRWAADAIYAADPSTFKSMVKSRTIKFVPASAVA